MNVKDRQISFARARVQPLENKLARSGNVEQRQILRRRSKSLFFFIIALQKELVEIANKNQYIRSNYQAPDFEKS